MNDLGRIVTSVLWSLEFGDPTPLGWITVAGYAVAAWYCWRVTAVFTPKEGRTGDRKNLLFWLAAALVVTFLGINKQLDLQSLLRIAGRELATTQGWYEHRRPWQAAFFAMLTILALLGAASLVWLVKGTVREKSVTLAGLFLLACFVLDRAASSQHVDALLGRDFNDATVNAALELSGILCVAIGSYRSWHRAKSPCPTGTKDSPRAADRRSDGLLKSDQ